MTEAKEATSVTKISLNNTKTAKTIKKSLEPEELLPKTARAKVKITRTKNVLSLNINANDTSALRAAINSFLRWAAIARDMTKLKEG